jgi:type II secretory pathway pseudopilin PulG
MLNANNKDIVNAENKTISAYLFPFVSKILKQNHGFSIFEVVVMIALLGITLPSILSIVGQFSVYHFKNKAANEFAGMASSKMEEIFAFKNSNTDWADTIEDFKKSEDMGGSYTRIVEVTLISDWISEINIDAYQIDVSVYHPVSTHGYKLTVVFAIE